MRVLVVDDDLVTRKLVADAVTQLGHDATAAGTGAEAWKMHCEDAFPIIICDWMMPEMDGLALCRHVRSSRKAGYSYFILLTAKSSRPDEAIAVESGIDDFLPKPMELESLAARLRVATRILKAEADLVASNRSLAASESQYRELFENQHDAVLVSSELTGVTNVNRAALHMFGMTPEMISARGELGLLSAEHLRFREGTRHSGEIFRGQFEFNRADGSMFPADVSSSQYPTEAGITTVTVIRDQSQIAQVELVLREGERRFRHLELIGMVSALIGCGLALATYFAVGIGAATGVVGALMAGHLALVVRSRRYRAGTMLSLARSRLHADQLRDEFERFSKNSSTDLESGLGNIRQLRLDWLRNRARAARRDESFALVMLDVREPSLVERRLAAHTVGAVVESLHRLLTPEDLLYRLDETTFAVLLEDTDGRGAEEFFDSARQWLGRKQYPAGESRVWLRVTGGVAAWTADMATAHDHLMRAGEALDGYSAEVARHASRFLPQPILEEA